MPQIQGAGDMQHQHERVNHNSKAMQWVKNRNNIIDMYKRKKVYSYEQQRNLSISLVDQDRLDVIDFLTQLKKCDSDTLPETKHWLGERTPSGQRKEPTVVRRVYTAPPAQVKKEEDSVTKPRHTEPDELARYDFQFRPRPKPDMVQRSQTLISIYQRRNFLVGQDINEWLAQEELGRRPQERKSPEERSESAALSHSEKNNPKAEILPQTADGTRRRNVGTYLPPSTALSGPAAAGRFSSAGGKPDDLMKDLLDGKSRRRKRRERRPLDERISSFYHKIDDMKEEEEELAKGMTEEEINRRWTVVTQGVKAALDMESDEEEDNPMHTI